MTREECRVLAEDYRAKLARQGKTINYVTANGAFYEIAFEDGSWENVEVNVAAHLLDVISPFLEGTAMIRKLCAAPYGPSLPIEGELGEAAARLMGTEEQVLEFLHASNWNFDEQGFRSSWDEVSLSLEQVGVNLSGVSKVVIESTVSALVHRARRELAECEGVARSYRERAENLRRAHDLMKADLEEARNLLAETLSEPNRVTENIKKYRQASTPQEKFAAFEALMGVLESANAAD